MHLHCANARQCRRQQVKVRNPVFDNSVEISGTFGTFFVQMNQGPGFANSGGETPSQADLGRGGGGEHIYIYINRLCISIYSW